MVESEKGQKKEKGQKGAYSCKKMRKGKKKTEKKRWKWEGAKKKEEKRNGQNNKMTMNTLKATQTKINIQVYAISW